MTINEQFEAAVAASKNLPAKPDNETLLKLYSLYKQASEGDAPKDGPDNMFDFVGKAKHQAWAALSGTGGTSAMEQYINLVNELKG